ncbi:MAG: helix-turn-helix transcriptional regulator [Thalassobaculum sp.]
MKATIAARVKLARAKAGLSQEELASRIERVVETISNIERARTLPTLATLELLAQELGVAVHELLAPRDASTKRPSARRSAIETRALAALNRMSDSDADMAADVVQLMADRLAAKEGARKAT